MTTPNVREQRPFGYWLRHIDGAIERSFGELLADLGVTRRDWQVLNTVSCGPITAAEVDATMAAFLSAADPTMRPYLDRLAERGWLDLAEDGAVALTGTGVAAHRGIAERIAVERARITECLSPEEFAVLMELLQRVGTHLEALSVA